MLGLLAVAAIGLGKDLSKPTAAPDARLPAAESPAPEPDPRLAGELARLAPQRPGHADLYVLAVAGDGGEAVFLNEALYLEQLAPQRLDAAGHVLVLANEPPRPLERPRPRADAATLAAALAGLGAAMDPDEDLLLLYATTHGTDDHRLLLYRDEEDYELLAPGELREALDAAGIRRRVLVLSACYAGGFIRALQDPDTLVLAAARRDRPSFGCGNDSAATYFGRAWLVDGLNAGVDFIEAFRQARKAIAAREGEEGLTPSEPQMAVGRRIADALAAWRAGFSPGSPLPYPYEESGVDDETADADAAAEKIMAAPSPGDKPSPP